MLFNSYAFIFAFFPFVLAGFFLPRWRSMRAAAGFLAVASLFFYGWWSIQALPLLVGSICVNYWFGLRLTPAPDGVERRPRHWLAIAIALNLALLGTFKYADFFVSNVNEGLAGFGLSPLPLLHVALPIGISFYTFTQIAFLVDCWQGKVRERSFVNYALFVTYFPHLVAGPVLHHAQMMPQFADRAIYKIDADKVALGLAIFTFGLAKKLVIADPMGQYADLVFNGARDGVMPTLYTSWFGVLAYTLQIYFDFSGYSDMAVGLSLCLGVWLPLNFNSPYKSTSIIEFWRRWHMSLSTFLRDYLYVPLGGNRKGPLRRYLNLFLTMLLGGLWHGAAWTFVVWGAMHGTFLIVNHLWNAKVRRNARPSRLGRIAGWLLTFVCVMVAWVVFRAENMHVATAIYQGMLGQHGAPASAFTEYVIPYRKNEFFRTLLIGLVICLALPPTITLARWVPQPLAFARHPAFIRPAVAVIALGTAALFGFSASALGTFSPFLYHRF
jgi:alginate O-acetyltransferase complex protein AlgI